MIECPHRPGGREYPARLAPHGIDSQFGRVLSLAAATLSPRAGRISQAGRSLYELIAFKATTIIFGVSALRGGAKDRVLQHARHHILGALGPTRIRMLFTLLRNHQFDALASCYFSQVQPP